MLRLARHHALPVFAVSFVTTLALCASPPTVLANSYVVAVFLAWQSRAFTAAWVGGGIAFALLCGAVAVDTSRPSRFVHAVGESRVEGELVATVMDGPLPYPGDRYRYRVRLEYWDDRKVEGDAAIFSESVLWPGDRVRVWTRLQRPARARDVGSGPREIAARKRVFLEGATREEAVKLGSELSLWRPIARARLRHVESVRRELPDELAASVIALTTGHKAFVSDQRSEVWNVSGTGHLLAISGLHFGMLAASLWGAGRWSMGWAAGIRRRWGARRVVAPIVAVLLAIALIWVGGPASARRAFVLAFAAAVAIGALRRVTPSRILALAAVALAAFDPPIVGDLGYQLSFAATASIVAVLEGPLAPDPLFPREGFRDRIVAFVALSTAASAATTPVLALHLGTVPVGGFWANLWAIPAVAGVIFPLISIGSVTAPFSPEFGFVVMEAGAWGMEAVAKSVEVTAGPATQWVTGRWSSYHALAVGFAVLVACRTTNRRWRWGASAIAVVIALTAVRAPPSAVEVHAIPVGQGDATLVLFPDGTTMLIDAGGSTHGRDPGSRIVVPYLWSLGVTRIDHLVVTHPDHDHVGGLAAVARNIELGAVVHDGCFDDPQVRGVRRAAQVEVGACGALEWGEDWRVRLSRPEVASADKNERSIIVEVTWRGARILMTGDAEEEGEAWWTQKLGRRATVLKLGHHGSKTSTTPELLGVARPVAAFVSAGRFSRFGHPDPIVVERVEGTGAAIGSSARDGLIIWTIEKSGAVTWRSRHPPPLLVQASVRRRTRSTGSSSRSGEIVDTPKRATTVDTNL